MLRILRAFAWLRWRVLVNSLERTGTRDTLERFSLAIEKIGPIMAAVLMVPSGLAIAGAALAGGFALGRGERALLFEVVRYALLAVPVLCILGPLFLPAADRTNPIRMLLLPIPRTTMYVAQTSSTFGDPWILLLIAAVLALPVGLAAGTAFAAAGVALLTGALLVLIMSGLSALVTSIIHLVARDRRRGELLALFFLIVLPFLAITPGLLDSERPRDAQGRRVRRDSPMPAWVEPAAARAFALVPSEMYARATRETAQGRAGNAGLPVAGLALMAALLHGAGFFAYGRVLDSPGTPRARRTGGMSPLWGRTIPFVAPATSAVALAHVRLALRTPRGRAILLSPIMMFGLFGVMIYRSGGLMRFGGFSIAGGLGLATFTASLALLSILPIAMNQFAVDRAGLTLALLSPIRVHQYLAGKAIGNGLVGGLPAGVALIGSALLFRSGSPALWLSLPLALLGVFLVVAPAAAIFSAIFPRVVDMNSIGRGSNAHGAAGLLGLLAFGAAALPCALLVLLATSFFERPALAPLFLVAWCAVAFGINRLLTSVAVRIFESRRENFTMLA